MEDRIYIDLRNEIVSKEVTIQGYCFSLYVADLITYVGVDDRGSVTAPVIHGLNSGSLAMWGMPEDDFKVNITNSRPKRTPSHLTHTFNLDSSGELGLGDGGDIDSWAYSASTSPYKVFIQHYLNSYNTPIFIYTHKGPVNLIVDLHFQWKPGQQQARLPKHSPHLTISISPTESFEPSEYKAPPWMPFFEKS